MGRAPWPKEEIAIDRTTILARLASCGIPASQVRLTGAEKVVVGRSVQTVKADDLVKVATEYVQQKLPGAPGGQWRLVRTPKDVTVPAGGPLLIEPRLVSNDPVSLTRVEVSVSVAGRQAATDQVHFKTVYPERKAVATCDIPAGAMLTPENVEIRTGMSDRPEPADWRPPYGQVAAEAVKAGTPVRGAAPKPPPPPEKIISRSDSVMMKIQGEGFVITALGQALDDGRPGGFIRVRNVDSSRIVVAKVMADGCVEPVLSGVRP
jgi:flagella basal body P-ring formation protein FlgA